MWFKLYGRLVLVEIKIVRFILVFKEYIIYLGDEKWVWKCIKKMYVRKLNFGWFFFSDLVYEDKRKLSILRLVFFKLYIL